MTRQKRASSEPGVPHRYESKTAVTSEPLYLHGKRRPLTPRQRVLHALPWVLVALPALYQLGLLATAIAGRVTYPYDLEWMEGGMLHHALRIQEGEGIYVPPSIEFIPYLYTPLYPSLLALLGGGFGLSYTLGRVISVLSLVGIAIVGALQIASKRHEHEARGPVWAGIALALGLFAASYPYMEGWFDLVRADTLFLFMVTAGIAALPKWAATNTGLRGHAQVAAGATVLALAFFCKQTAIVYVALGGAIVLVIAWRRLVTYVVVAGAIGLGGTAILDRVTDGWFWIYIRKIHAAHDFNMDRFWKSFGNILLKFPAMTIVVGLALVVVVWTWIERRKLPRQAHPFLLWTAAFAVSTLIGAIGWGTEFAHFNAYMPAFLHGALAAGAAIPALYACWRLAFERHPRAHAIASGASLGAALVLAATCWTAKWQPARFMPTANDAAAGDRLIARLRAIDGDVWMPSHPWYLYLAGKSPYVHRMGIKDVTTRQTRVVLGLDEAVRSHAFAALVLDDRDLHLELPVLHASYRPALKLPANERPRLYTGAKVIPDSIWVPATRRAPPEGAQAVFDFEHLQWNAWRRSGTAWGNGPVQTSVPGQPIVLGASGQRFATSMHGGDAAVGRVTSPPLTLAGRHLTVRAGGGSDATKLRVELWVDGAIVAVASVPAPGGETLQEITLPIPGEHRDQSATLVFVDDSPHGHLTVDDVWLWE